MMFPKNFFDKLKIFSLYPDTYKDQAYSLMLELKEHKIHPATINWGAFLGNWKHSLTALGLIKEIPSEEYPFNLLIQYKGWEFE